MTLTIPSGVNQRLDAYLADQLPDLSRSQIQVLIKQSHILLNGTKVKARTLLKTDDKISIKIPETQTRAPQAENIPLHVLHEDSELIVINKAPGMVVHPAAGNSEGTLVNALLHHCSGQLADGNGNGENRPGIVHRLDKDTSGCIIAAKTNESLKNLSEQFAARKTKKLYLAVSQSPPQKIHQSVFNNIARHPVHRQKMDVCNPGTGKPAITDLHLLHTKEDGTSLILCALHTGRTHQIRVHNRFLGHPLLGDPIYSKIKHQKSSPTRLMLHAWRLGIQHPNNKEWLQSEAPIPDEFHPWTQQVTEKLAQIRLINHTPDLNTLW